MPGVTSSRSTPCSAATSPARRIRSASSAVGTAGVGAPGVRGAVCPPPCVTPSTRPRPSALLRRGRHTPLHGRRTPRSNRRTPHSRCVGHRACATAGDGVRRAGRPVAAGPSHWHTAGRVPTADAARRRQPVVPRLLRGPGVDHGAGRHPRQRRARVLRHGPPAAHRAAPGPAGGGLDLDWRPAFRVQALPDVQGPPGRRRTGHGPGRGARGRAGRARARRCR